LIGTRIPFGSKSGSRVLVSIPTRGKIHKKVAQALLGITLRETRVGGDIIMPTNNPLENNQHHIINDLLSREYDYWLSFDDDNPPTKNPFDLIALDLDVVSCPTPVWHYSGKKGERFWYWNAYDYAPLEDAYREHLPQEGLQKVDAIGGGCFLISRRVFEHPEMQLGAFHRTYLSSGIVDKGNDISFSERAGKQGFDLYTHYDYPCRHMVTLDLLDMIEAVRDMNNG
jgi:hypothetical protein